MKVVWLIIVGLNLYAVDASFDCVKAKTKIEKMICSSNVLAQKDKVLSRVYITYKNQLTDDKKDKLIIAQRKWNRTREICFLLEPDNNELIHSCLLEQYISRIDSLDNKIGEKNKLSNLYRKLLKLYQSKYIYTDKTQIELYNKKACNEKEVSATKGLMTLYIYYYALINIEKKKSFSSTDITFQGYRDTKFISRFLGMVEKDELLRYLDLALNHLNNEELDNIYNLLEYLNKVYKIFSEKTSKDMIEKLNKESYDYYNNFDNKIFNINKKSCFSFVHNTKKLYVNKFEIDYENFTSVNSFVYTFWLRRYNDKTIDDVHEIIEFLLQNIKKLKDK